MTVRATEAGSAGLEGIGKLLTPNGPTAPASGEFSFAIVSPELGLGPGLCAGALACSHRKARLERMERHLRTPEILSAVQGDAILCAAPPQEAKDGAISGIAAIVVRQGQSVLLEAGAWHWIPFPLDAGGARFMVLFKNGTGDEDLEIRELRDPRDIEWKGVKP
jgi:hypothetical protein